MVNHRVVSRFSEQPPLSMNGRAKIAGGPLYSADEVVRILNDAPPVFGTSKCIKDAQNLCLDDTAVGMLLKEAVTQGRYKDSEWCELKSGGPIAACDAYELKRMEWNEFAHKELECNYFLKFAIAKTGKIVVTVSCHT